MILNERLTGRSDYTHLTGGPTVLMVEWRFCLSVSFWFSVGNQFNNMVFDKIVHALRHSWGYKMEGGIHEENSKIPKA